MQVWFDQTQPWCNLTWMLLHTASASGCTSCTGTGTLVFSTRDSQAGSSILNHGDAFDHIFMTTKIKQTSEAWTFIENYRKVIKIPPWRFNKKKGRTLSDSTNSEVPKGDSVVLLTPTLKQVATARSATAVPLLSVLMKWSRKPGETIDGPPKFCFKKEFSMVLHVAERIAFKWYMCTSSSKSSEFLSIAKIQTKQSPSGMCNCAKWSNSAAKWISVLAKVGN